MADRLDRKAADRPARKRCGKCGKVGWYAKKEWHCKRQAFGPGSFWCYGTLTADPIRRQRAPETEASRGAQYRTKAARKAGRCPEAPEGHHGQASPVAAPPGATATRGTPMEP